MTTDTQIAKYADTLIQDMYMCGKQGMFKGYVNWFMLSYSNAVEARKQMDNFRQMVTVNKPRSVGPTVNTLLQYVDDFAQMEPGKNVADLLQKRAELLEKEPFRQVIEMHMPDRISDVLFDTPDDPRIQGQSPLTVKHHPDGTIEYGYDPTKGTCEQAARDFMKIYPDAGCIGSTAIIPALPTGTAPTGGFDLTTDHAINLNVFERPAQTDTRG